MKKKIMTKSIRDNCEKIENNYIMKKIEIDDLDAVYSKWTYENFSIIINNENKFVNGTRIIEEAFKYENELRKSQGVDTLKDKKISAWFRNESTNIFIENIKHILGIEVIKNKVTVNRYSKHIIISGTYIHIILASYLVNWVSPAYALKVNEIIYNMNK